MKFRFKTRTISEELNYEDGSDHELKDNESSEFSTKTSTNETQVFDSVNDAYLFLQGNGSFQKWCALFLGLTLSLNIGYNCKPYLFVYKLSLN